MSNSTLTPCSVEDFLEQDKSIRGQNYACLSFISPEDVIIKKEAFQFQHYMQNFTNDLDQLFKGLSNKYPNDDDGISSLRERYSAMFDASSIHSDFQAFVAENPHLETQYHEQNNFQTSIRGIKVRGVYDTLGEAQKRSELLKSQDNNRFNIYVAQVGCWCPWAPNPSEIENQEYAETQLNTLVKEYRKNVAKKEAFFEERKEELMKKAILANEKNNTGVKMQVVSESDVPENLVPMPLPGSVPEPPKSDLESDPWLERKNPSDA